MKAQILKISGCKTEKEFYAKFPSEEAFMKKHGKEFKKAQNGLDIMSGALQDVSGQSRNIDGSFTRQATPPMLQGKAFSSMPVPALQNQQPTPWTPPAPKQSADLSKLAGPAAGIVQAVQAFGEQKKAKQRAEQNLAVSNVQLDASKTTDVDINRQMADNMTKKRAAMMPVTTGEELSNPLGEGTNVLAAKNGMLLNRVGGNPAEIQNTYYPNDIYTNGGFEPLDDSNVKNYYHGGGIPRAQNGFMDYLTGAGSGDLSQAAGMAFNNNAGSQMGKGVGDLVKMIPGVGPVAGALAAPILGAIGGGLDKMFGSAGKIEKANEATSKNIDLMSMQGMGKGLQQQNSSFMEDGGWVSHDWLPQVITQFGDHTMKSLMRPDPTMDTLRAGGHLQRYTPPSEEAMQTYAMGGDLKIHWGGYAEPMSQNPYLPEGGETVMFKGNLHTKSDRRGNTGIGVTYGDNPVEVERGEPAVKLQDGGAVGDPSLVVFGNLDASILPDPKAKGKKFKNYIADLSKTEAKQNKTIDRASIVVNELDPRSAFEKLTFASQQANILGANMTLKNIAEKKQKAADFQQAIKDVADDNDYDVDALARGQIKQAKKGITITQNGDRAVWDIPGRVGDWAENKIGQAYQNYVPENAKNAIRNVSDVMSYPLEALEENWNPGAIDRAKQYKIDNPVIGGVAPAVGLGMGAKAFRMSEKLGAVPSRFVKAENVLSKSEQVVQDAIDKAYPTVVKAATKKVVAAKPGPAATKAAEKVTKLKNFENKFLTNDAPLKDPGNAFKYIAGGIGAGGVGLAGAYRLLNDDSNNTSIPPIQNQYSAPTPPPKSNDRNTLYELMGSRRQKFEDGGTAEWGEGILSKEELARREQDHNVGKTALQNPYDPWIWGNQSQLQPMMRGVTPAGKQVAQQVQIPTSVGKRKAPVKEMTIADMIAARSPSMKLKAPPPSVVNISKHSASDFNKLKPLNVEAKTAEAETNRFPWEQLANEVLPYLRPSDARDLDPRQLYGEMYALSNNQQEPVYAQGFNPQLTVPYDISMQDVLNKNQADFRAAQRTMGYNPAAQANLAAQQYQANQGVLGDQFRMNQEMKNKTYAQNRQALDQAQMTNLGIFSQQAEKQSMAKSNTKAQTQAALQSISAKLLENEAKNKELKTYENLYNYRFGNNQRAQNWNPLAQFNMEGTNTKAPHGNLRSDLEYSYDDAGNITGVKPIHKPEKTGKNGVLVKSFK